MVISFKCFQNSMTTGLLMAKTNNECYILKHSIDRYKKLQHMTTQFNLRMFVIIS